LKEMLVTPKNVRGKKTSNSLKKHFKSPSSEKV